MFYFDQNLYGTLKFGPIPCFQNLKYEYILCLQLDAGKSDLLKVDEQITKSSAKLATLKKVYEEEINKEEEVPWIFYPNFGQVCDVAVC